MFESLHIMWLKENIEWGAELDFTDLVLVSYATIGSLAFIMELMKS